MPQNASSPAFFVKDPFTDEVQGPFNIQQLKHWYYQGGFESWMVGKSNNGPWKQASKIKGLSSLQPSNPTNAITNSDSDSERNAFYKHIQEQKYIQDSIQDSFGNRSSNLITASSTAPSPPPITKNEETDLPATNHKKLALWIVILGLSLFGWGVYSDNKVSGGLGIWTTVLGCVFWFYGNKIKILWSYLFQTEKKVNKKLEHTYGSNQTEIECRMCKGKIHVDAKVCPHCRAWQNPNEYLANFGCWWVVLMVLCTLFGLLMTSAIS